ncbi:hypothetical protein BD779DRAFT_1608790 [Infundibulicybe gibba]|nr:hypothetical protein BD779DRAFT_1608790 [Infundibulicybe gibba]
MDNILPGGGESPQAGEPTSTNIPPGNDEPVIITDPPKRKPGRPKGSTKKNIAESSLAPKIKRPVGRPRKDGLPAGSTGSPKVPRQPKQARVSNLANFRPSQWPATFPPTGIGYPPMAVPNFTSAIQNPSGESFKIDPILDHDDWADLARTKPNSFLATLLVALAAPNPTSSAGPSVEEAFKSHLVSLAPNPAQLQPIPSLYSILKTFWLPASPAYFSLTASASTARTPSEHRFLYWDPQPLVFNGIACPSCSTPLINRGRISTGPIKIYDIEKPFFIVGCEYVCKSSQCVTPISPEGRKFASTDSSILRSLPVKLKDEFPARLMYPDIDAGSGQNIWNWKALGVSLSLWNMVCGSLRAGLKRDAILKLIQAIQNGVPEVDVTEDGSEEEEEEVIAQAASESTPAPQSAPPDGPNQSITDAYSDAWKANSAATATGAPSTAATQDTSSPTLSTTAAATQSSTSSSQPFEYSKTFPPYTFGPFTFFTTPGAGPSQLQSVSNSNKRPYPFGNDAAGTPNSDAGTQDGQQKRSPRHCCKCGSQDCKGKGGRNFCTNPCQDCGKLDCKGRNSRRPDKKCVEGWAGTT